MTELIISQALYDKYFYKFNSSLKFKNHIVNFNQSLILDTFINSFTSFSLNPNSSKTRITYIKNEIDEIIATYDNMINYLKMNNLNPIWTLYDFKNKIDKLMNYISLNKTSQFLNKLVLINTDLSNIKSYYSSNEINNYIKRIKDQIKNIEHDYNKIDTYENVNPIKNKSENIGCTFTRPLYSKSPGIIIMKSPSPLIQEDEISENSEVDLSELLNPHTQILNEHEIKNEDNEITNPRAQIPNLILTETEMKTETENKNIPELLTYINNQQSQHENENDEIMNSSAQIPDLILPESENKTETEIKSETENKNIPELLEYISNQQSQHENELNLTIQDLNLVNINNLTPEVKQTQNIVIPVDTYNQLSKDSEDYNKLIPFKTFSSQKLGVIGESFICDVLNQLHYQFENTTKTPHVGDIRITFDNFIIMFEIKNKKLITLDDITKFRFDINNLKNITHKTICGCFISLVSNSILNISDLQFNLYETYIPHDSLNISTIQIYIEAIKSIMSNDSEIFENKIIDIKNKLNDEIINYNNELEICQKHMNYSLELNKDMMNLKYSLENKLNTLKSILSGINPDFNKELLAKQELINYIQNNKKWTLSECKNIINKHGLIKVVKTKNDVLKYIGFTV